MSCAIGAGRQETPGGLIYVSDLLSLTHHAHPHHATAGFSILQPRRHVEHIADLTPDEGAELARMLRLSSRAIMNAFQPEKIYVCSFGSLVKHVHFYLIPKLAAMPAGATLLAELEAGRWACSEAEAAEAAAHVGAELTRLLTD